MTKFLQLFILVILISLICGLAKAQSIQGKITDAANSDALVGAVVKIVNTNLGAVSDLDGTYQISDIKPGNYDLEFSYIGYKSRIIKSVIVTAKEVSRLDITLSVEGVVTEEIKVEATQSLANEESLLNQQKNSSKIQDGISEQQIKRAPDAAASDVLKRVTGVNIVNSKFVFVRGLSERYSNTTLNGVLITSTDPDKKAFSFDIFPSAFLENIIVTKSFTPDQPGNSTGGLVKLSTKDFPESFTLDMKGTSSLTTQTTGKDFSSYNASQSKMLFYNSGADDGGRLLPSSFPSNSITKQNFSPEQLQSFGQSFRNNWQQNKISAPVNGGFQVSLGNRYKFLKNPLGFFFSYAYKNSFDNKDVETNSFNTDNTQISGYKGKASEYSVNNGGLFNLNYKIGQYNKIGFKNTYNLSSEDNTDYFEGSYYPEFYLKKLYRTKFTERTLFSSQLLGSSYLPKLNNLNVDWNLSYSESKRKEPDLKTITYQRDPTSKDTNYFAPILTNTPNSDAGGRFFSNLYDINHSGGINFDLPVKLKSNLKLKFNFGGLASTTSRSFSARNFAPALNSGASFLIDFEPIDSIFRPENISPTKIYYSELTRQTDAYGASEDLYAGYGMLDIPVGKLRVIAGARFEYDYQKLNTVNILIDPVNVRLKNNDWLPSMNLVYALNDKTNIRASVSETVSRPEFREIAPFSYTDFVTGITILGNSTDLKRTKILNYDLRMEWYPNAGEILALSGFYKHFYSPIEKVFLSSSTNRIQTFENAHNGAIDYGIEIEAVKKLGFISNLLKDFSINCNLSLIDSKVNIEGIGSVATNASRPLQGQSPYTINAGLFYDNYISGTSINLLYNKFGKRISEVGLNGFNDIYEQGRGILDFSASQRFLSNFEAKITIKDILNKDILFTQKVNDKDETINKIKEGTTSSLTLTYKFNK